MTKPNFQEEIKLWKKGFKYVIGIDEVGRGAFAGPVVAAATVWKSPLQFKIEDVGINDSKLLTPNKRETLAKVIKENCLAWDITEVGASVINRIGIGKATEKTMRKTVRDIHKSLEQGYKEVKSNPRSSLCPSSYLLIDGFHLKYVKGLGLKNQKAIIKGDRKSISIAAASILAKVYRDKLMISLSKHPKYKKYHWGENKGYGTEVHRKMILRYGLTRYHRKMFVKTFLEKVKDLKTKI